MKIRHEYERVPDLEIWNIVVAYIKENRQFMSVTGVKYNAMATADSVDYKGGKEGCNRAMKGESIGKDLFISALNQIRTLECINTSNVKPYINRKQSPFVGLLHSAGIIE